MPGHQLRPERADKSGGRTFLGPPSYRDSAGPRDVAQEAGRVLTLTGSTGAWRSSPRFRPRPPGRRPPGTAREEQPPAAGLLGHAPGPRTGPPGHLRPRPAPMTCAGRLPPCWPAPTRGMMPIPAAGSPRPWPRWPAPAMAPMTPPWSGRHDPCCLPSPAIPSPPHPRSPQPPPGCGGPSIPRPCPPRSDGGKAHTTSRNVTGLPRSMGLDRQTVGSAKAC